MTRQAARTHDTAVAPCTGWPLILAQTMVEYGGVIASIAAGFVALKNRFEMYVGQGNAKYVLIGALLLIILLLVRRPRRY